MLHLRVEKIPVHKTPPDKKHSILFIDMMKGACKYMSKYKIEAKKTIEVNGILYSATIRKEVEINFASVRYSVKRHANSLRRFAEIEFVPDNFDFLREVTAIFPLSDYKIKIMQYLYRRSRAYVAIYFSICNKKTGKQVFLPEKATLSDTDYDYMKGILEEALPEYKWITSKEHVTEDIKAYLLTHNLTVLFTDKAIEYLEELIGERWDDIKKEGYDDFDINALNENAAQILESALCEAYKGCQ